MRILKTIKTCIKSIVGYFVFDEYKEINSIFLGAEVSKGSEEGLENPKINSGRPKNIDTNKNQHISFLPYQNPVVKKTIWNMKYKRDIRAISIYADIFYDEIVSSLSDRVCALPFCAHKVCMCNVPYIIYSPSSSFALVQKDYDQMQVVVQNMEKYFNNLPHSFGHTLGHTFAHICHGAILYNKSGNANEAQHTKNKVERKRLAKNRFRVSKEFIQYINETSALDGSRSGVNIICLDDVTTTGATFTAIQNLLKKELGQNIKSVKCFALCH